MDPVTESLEKARKTLLDLGLQNTLLNYRELKSKGIRVVDGRPEEVFRVLVDEARSISFLPKTHETVQQPPKVDPSALQTPYTDPDLHRRLLNTYYAARTAIEEHGVNILFLALGMLDWYEDKSSDLLRRAPLILVPVSLFRAGVQTRFKLEYTKDEIDTNLPLQSKLMELGIELPSIAEEDGGLVLQDFFKKVAEAIQYIPRWRVDRDAIALGFFSFSKLLMYKDLDEANWPEGRKPSAHGVLRSILHEGFKKMDALFKDDENLDERIDPADLHQVRDADSSQMIALLEAKAGRNLVIQGPPGTGKSQTITNLVAEAIAEGRTVLFVSEKMAALEVVKRRLDEVGLGNACLELHSHKTNKKAFLDELERTLGLKEPQHTDLDECVKGVKKTRERLNRYCRTIHDPIGESGVTPFSAYGTLLQLTERLKGIKVPPIEDMTLHEWSKSEYAERLGLTEELQALLGKMGVPEEHAFWGSSRTVFLPKDYAVVKGKSGTARECLGAVRDTATRLADAFDVVAPGDLPTLVRWIATARQALKAPNLTGVPIDRPEWHSKRDALDRAVRAGKRIRDLHARFDDRLVPEAWNADAHGIHKELAAYAARWWRFLSPTYLRARRKILGLCRMEPPRSPAGLLEAAEAILEAQARSRHLEEAAELLTELFGARLNGWRSDWAGIEAVTAYLAATHDKVKSGQLPEELLHYLKQLEGHETLPKVIESGEERLTAYREALQEAVTAVALDVTARFGEGGVSALQFESQDALLGAWVEQVSRLQEMVKWNHLTTQMRDRGLAPVVDLATTWTPAAAHLIDTLDRAWHSLLVDRAMNERPVLAEFMGSSHNLDLQKFRKLDKSLLELNRAYLAHKHWASLPAMAGDGQIGVLGNEFAKKKKHRPIRRLILDAGQAIQTIKPVFMMSPLSVAAYIPPESVRFDVVVFDEASQVRPVDAFGAILRGEQTVVVGDSKQLPPTSFFDKVGTDEEEEEQLDTVPSDLESILDLFSAKGAPKKMLHWHYRSRHESLIEVSNSEFYDNKLVVFPGPDGTRQDVGLVFRHLPDAAYEPGKAVNRKETTVVAQAVMEHALARPDLTLGVASFSLSQMEAIQDELELLRRQDSSCESFFAAHQEEPFFVKNLENVQGDERDVILISVGYGRTAGGSISMNFGPLNQAGGERRLNVLITRARRRCVVFSNLRSDDIDMNKTKALGVVALKTFLKYAETGFLDEPKPPNGEPDSPFEVAVGRALSERGFAVRYQVGSAGFRIDLAVVDQERPGRYLLGIECDGATYHRARWARDRDRLRQDVLESLGWRIHRIWSTDWFRDPEDQLKRVAESVDKAKIAQYK